MNRNVTMWLYGLGAAVIGGGASAVTSTVTASLVAPDKFNLAAQLHNFFILAGATFVVNGLLSAAAYLKQSPLPPETVTSTTTLTTSTTAPAPAPAPAPTPPPASGK